MIDLQTENKILATKTPREIVEWSILHGDKAIVTTNFGPYSSSILHVVSSVKRNIQVIWIDTGYNTPQTYKYADALVDRLGLNLHTYIPNQTVAYRNHSLGIPEISHPNHKIFTEQVKLEPFQRAMKDFQPDVWFTNIRKGQTKFRDSLDILSYGKNGILKVSPFYHFTDEQLNEYLIEHELPNETRYYDPTKALSNRECGLHTIQT